MSITHSLKESISRYISEIIVVKGHVVLPEGEYAYGEEFLTHVDGRWRDAPAQQHVKGGWMGHPETKRSFEVPACGWQNEGWLSKDSMETNRGKVSLEVSGLTCNCGRYQNKTVRLQETPDKFMKRLGSAISKHSIDFVNNAVPEAA